jgi:beta-N-acetylhexosaminidase
VYALLRRRQLGGVVVLRRNWVSRAQITALAGEATVVARRARHIPPFVLTMQDGGDFNELPGLPPASAPADLDSVDAGASQASDAAKALAAANFSGVLGPSIDVGTGGDDAVGAQAFSNLPAQVARYGAAVIAAYRREGLLAAAAHYPGQGAATQPVEDGPASVGLNAKQLFDRDLVPFRTAIGAGVPAVVISNAAYVFDDFVVPATQSERLSTDNLRAVFGFRGVAIADDLAAAAVTNSTSVADAAVGALKAGSDMVYISGTARGQEAAYDALIAAVKSGTLPVARLDEAVTRVLSLKRELGLVRGLRPRTRVRPEAATAPPVVPVPGAVPGTVPPGAPAPPAAGTPAAPAPTP